MLGEHALGVEEAGRSPRPCSTSPASSSSSPAIGTGPPRPSSLAPGLRSEGVPDIELAALALEHGLVLASHDRGFARFPGLRYIDPLA